MLTKAVSFTHSSIRGLFCFAVITILAVLWTNTNPNWLHTSMDALKTDKIQLLINSLVLRFGKVPNHTSSISNRRYGGEMANYYVDPVHLSYWHEHYQTADTDTVEGSPLALRIQTPDDLLDKPKDDEDSRERTAEALSTLHAAVEFKKRGKFEKAKKLLEHALALAPRHPDILTEYGLFVENVDVLSAEAMYTKALVYCPWHEGALSNRERTLPLVEEIDNRMLQRIDEKRRFFLGIPRTNAGLKRAMRENYFQHVYHTVALEGNTMTLMQTRSLLETRLAIGGKSVMEHNEILGLDAALKYINQSLVNRIGRITIEDLFSIHRRVLGFVDPLQAGVLRTTQVYVGSFAPVAPEELSSEMNEFVSWLNSEDTLRIHPVELAALAHYKFVYIHPFVDGNGRTARLLMNLILMQAGFPPVIIRLEDRLEYYETLRTANEGDLRPFIRLIAAATERTLAEYLAQSTVGPASKNMAERHSDVIAS